jgi:hypothetical protein
MESLKVLCRDMAKRNVPHPVARLTVWPFIARIDLAGPGTSISPLAPVVRTSIRVGRAVFEVAILEGRLRNAALWNTRMLVAERTKAVGSQNLERQHTPLGRAVGHVVT